MENAKLKLVANVPEQNEKVASSSSRKLIFGMFGMVIWWSTRHPLNGSGYDCDCMYNIHMHCAVWISARFLHSILHEVFIK